MRTSIAGLIAALLAASLLIALVGPSISLGPLLSIIESRPKLSCIVSMHMLVGFGLILEGWLAAHKHDPRLTRLAARAFVLAGVMSFGVVAIEIASETISTIA